MVSQLIKPDKRNLVWQPQPGPQTLLVRCPAPEIFYGGSRGGGKTDGMLGKWLIKDARYGSAFNAVMLRRTTVSSIDAIDRSRQIYGLLGGRFFETKPGAPLTWKMPNGGRVSFGYLDSSEDAQEYQGRNLTDVWIEEAGQYPDPAPIWRMFGTLRSAQGVPVQMVLTGNPGGPGQRWIRERYELSPFPKTAKVLHRRIAEGFDHEVAVIPSRLTDNLLLLKRDPGYIGRLHLVGNDALVRAWLEGDWNAIEGAFFDEWSDKKHVVEPFKIPADWLRFRSMDWGSARPFSVGWWAVVGDDHALADGRTLPRGALVRYREWYGAKPGQANQGLKLTAEEVGAGIVERERGETIRFGVLDPSAFREDGGPSIAEMMRRINNWKGPQFWRADNTRVARVGALSGWAAVRARLKGADGVPMLYVFSTCPALISTVPLLQHDTQRIEDLDTDAEDHAADDMRYACLSRPWVPASIDRKVVQIAAYRPHRSAVKAKVTVGAL
jgi:Phage terminase large subunit